VQASGSAIPLKLGLGAGVRTSSGKGSVEPADSDVTQWLQLLKANEPQAIQKLWEVFGDPLVSVNAESETDLADRTR
jgi:hypothetical protein